MASQTLHDVLKPLLGFLDFSGITWRREKNCVKRGLKMHNVFVWIVFISLIANVRYVEVREYLSSKTGKRIIQGLMLINLFFTLVCIVRWASLERLLDILKVCRMSPKIWLKFKKISILAFSSIAILFPFIFVVVSAIIFTITLVPIGYLCEDTDAPLDLIVYYTILIAIMWTVIVGYILIMFTGLLVLPILTLTVCCMAHYVHLTLEEALEELKLCQSSLRRARVTTRIVELFDRLNQLIEPTNRIADPLIFAQYVIAIYQFTMVSTFVKKLIIYEHYQIVIILISVNYVVIMSLVMYLWYLRVSPKANNMRSLIAKTLVETVLKDDQWLSRDLGSRPLLLKVIIPLA